MVFPVDRPQHVDHSLYLTSLDRLLGVDGARAGKYLSDIFELILEHLEKVGNRLDAATRPLSSLGFRK